MGDAEETGTREQTPEDLARVLGASAPVRSGFAPGDALPGLSSWRLERRIGRGGFGEVWLAKHAWNHHFPRGAVKFFTHPGARHPLVVHEMRVIVRVLQQSSRHPNIVSLLECNIESETPWLMYEFIEGGTLSERIAEWSKLSPTERLPAALDALRLISEALAHVHRIEPAVVHRDLKPSNILMDGETPRVTDFGIGSSAASAQADSLALPTLIRSSATLGYASPEQQRGEAPHPRDDVYALGVIAFQMLTGDLGTRPGPDTIEELDQLGVPQSVSELIVKSVSRQTGRRPSDATEWQRVLAALWIRRRIQIPVWGIWYARPALAPDAAWVRVVGTPNEVTVRIGEEYQLWVSSSTTDDECRGLNVLAEVDTFRSLAFSKEHQISDAGVAHLTVLRRLRSLSLSGCAQLTDAGVARITELKTLQTLDLSECPRITDAALVHLGSLSGLKSLNVMGCARITQEGINAFKTALPACKIAQHVPGATPADLRDVDPTLAGFQEGAGRAPTNAAAHYHLGLTLKARGDLGGAIGAFREAITHNPKYTSAHFNLGIALDATGDYEGAISALREAIKLDPKDVLAHTHLGLALGAKGDPDGAIATYLEIIKLDPQNPTGHNYLAWYFAVGPDQVRDGRRAVELALRACELTSWREPSCLDSLGAAYAEIGEFEKASEQQKKALTFADFEKRFGTGARQRLELYSQKKPYRDPRFALREVTAAPHEQK